MAKPRLISIVEDDEPFRESMRKLMTALGYTVEVFPSARDFLASPLLTGTACLVSDVQMPGMSGVELHKHLIKAGHLIPTILVTAYPDEMNSEPRLDGWGGLLSPQACGRRPSRTLPSFGSRFGQAARRELMNVPGLSAA